VAGPEILSLREICDAIGEAVGRIPLYISEPGEPRHIVGDIVKMKELLAPPRIVLRDGLRSVLAAG
jgi:hypothetical protein